MHGKNLSSYKVLIFLSLFDASTSPLLCPKTTFGITIPNVKLQHVGAGKKYQQVLESAKK